MHLSTTARNKYHQILLQNLGSGEQTDLSEEAEMKNLKTRAEVLLQKYKINLIGVEYINFQKKTIPAYQDSLLYYGGNNCRHCNTSNIPYIERRIR